MTPSPGHQVCNAQRLLLPAQTPGALASAAGWPPTAPRLCFSSSSSPLPTSLIPSGATSAASSSAPCCPGRAAPDPPHLYWPPKTANKHFVFYLGLGLKHPPSSHLNYDAIDQKTPSKNVAQTALTNLSFPFGFCSFCPDSGPTFLPPSNGTPPPAHPSLGLSLRAERALRGRGLLVLHAVLLLATSLAHLLFLGPGRTPGGTGDLARDLESKNVTPS